MKSGLHSKGGEADQNRKLNDSYTSLGNYSTMKSNDDINSVSVAATSTTATSRIGKSWTTDVSSSSGARRRRSLGSAGHYFKQSITAANDTASLRVSRMLYTTPSGENGWYTGTVNYRGVPHGQGEMRTKTGHVIEGMWKNGNRCKTSIFASPGLDVGMWSSNHHPGGIYHYPTGIHSQPLNGVQQHQERLPYPFQGEHMACPSPRQTTIVGTMLNHSPGGSYPFSTFIQSQPLSGNQEHQAQMQYPSQEERMTYPSQTLPSSVEANDVKNN